jgi:hypothetical protein
MSGLGHQALALANRLLALNLLLLGPVVLRHETQLAPVLGHLLGRVGAFGRGNHALGLRLLLHGLLRNGRVGGAGRGVGAGGVLAASGGGGNVGGGIGGHVIVVVGVDLRAVDFGVLAEAVLHVPVRLSAMPCHAIISNRVRAGLLEVVDAVHALGLLLAEDEAAEGSLELVSTRPGGHAAQARAVPVDLARLGVEGALLVGLSL